MAIFHAEYQKDFDKGYQACADDLAGMSFEACREKFNLENPIGQKPASMGAYYWARGYMERLAAEK